MICAYFFEIRLIKKCIHTRLVEVSKEFNLIPHNSKFAHIENVSNMVVQFNCNFKLCHRNKFKSYRVVVKRNRKCDIFFALRVTRFRALEITVCRLISEQPPIATQIVCVCVWL